MIIQIQTKAKKREVRLIKSQAPAIENNTIPVIAPIMIRCNMRFSISFVTKVQIKPTTLMQSTQVLVERMVYWQSHSGIV